MNKCKQFIKKVIYKNAGLFTLKSRLGISEAKGLLEQWSPKPNGICLTKNIIDIKYDLQIIVPAYNSEKYIEECLKSVLSQEHEYSVLITVVNDGSTDATAEILEKLRGVEPKSNTRLEIITQENKGFSGARNTGLKVLKGTYISFLDSDDVLPTDILQIMLNTAYTSKKDIVQGELYRFTDTEPSEERIKDSKKGDINTLSGYPCGKIYRYTVLENYCFPEGYWYEDTPISFILFGLPYSHEYLNEVVYGYRQNPQSITYTSVSKKKSIDTYWITEECLKEFPLFGLSYDQRAYEYLLKQSIMNAGRIRKQSRKIREAVFILTHNLINTYFTDMKTNSSSMAEIEKALKNKQFLRFELLIKSIGNK